MKRFLFLVPLVTGALAPLIGCSESVPPPSEGAWYVDFKAGSHGSSCTIAGVQPLYVGDMSKPECIGKSSPVDQAQHCGLSMDGRSGIRNYCAVLQQGASYRLEGYLEQGANLLRFTVPTITAAATQAQPAHGIVTFTSSEVQQTYMSPDSDQCLFYFNAAQAAQLAPGRMWVTFECPTVQTSGTSVASVCTIMPSFFAFQNCDE